MLLVGCMHMLLSETISARELDLSDILLAHFVSEIGTLYGKQYLAFNVHQLTHLVLSVRR